MTRAAKQTPAHLNERVSHATIELAMTELDRQLSFFLQFTVYIVARLGFQTIAVLHVYRKWISKITLEAEDLIA